MRTVQKWNDSWYFIKEAEGQAQAAEIFSRCGAAQETVQSEGGEAAGRQVSAAQPVTLPHTWNAQDGQDGGNDYYRGTCWYAKRFARPSLAEGEEAWLEFRGAAMTAHVFVNGQELACHEGGYSTFRVNITPALREGENELLVSVDNGKNRRVYPQKADFTFYGGLYRDVYLITVPRTHFALGYYGAPGLSVVPLMRGGDAEVTMTAWLEGAPEGTHVLFQILDGDGVVAAEKSAPVQDGKAQITLELVQAHRWDGKRDPYLYTAQALLLTEIAAPDAVSLYDGKRRMELSESADADRVRGFASDQIQVRFGCREIAVDSERGFLLNGRPYPLCGAARHQDRQGIGNALTQKEHEEDMALLLEMGANTVRLAHYQHDQYFYDLCDRCGMIAWVEIPYITEHMPEARENTLSQMTELVVQNSSHPSIVCWGLSNEITAAGGVSDDLRENHRLLHELCHRLDPTRPTAMAHAFMLDPADPLVSLPDISSYNLYYGWYLGELEANDQFFDDFHAQFPQAVIGLSEFGADANPQYQSAQPERGDWTEGYQALYHEHMLRLWKERPYIWAMHVWNMFDFGADGRQEGGKPGQNQKGLVTFDRKLKKDAFYLYKAYLSDEPFVHLCGRRYADRAEEETQIKVYSNQQSVTLLVDGEEYGTQEGGQVFCFTVPLIGKHRIEVRGGADGSLRDEMEIRRAEEPNPAYRNGGGEVVNWFDKPEELERPGYFSILDTMADIKKNPAGAALIERVMAKARESYGEVAHGITMPESVQKLMDLTPLQKTLRQAGKAVTPAMVKELNHALNQIKK